jgi:hypothetical protein
MIAASKSPARIRKGAIVAVRAHAELWRPRTSADHDAWLASEDSRGMDCAGETKLDSPTRMIRADGRTYTVTRARVSAQRGWGQVSKCAELKDSDGTLWFARRADLAVVRGA